MLVQTFRPEASIEGFDEGIVRWLAGPGEVKDHPALVGPEIHVARDELAALIDPDRLGIARRSAHPVERIVVHNRGEGGLAKRLDGFTLVALDADRTEVFRVEQQPAPASTAVPSAAQPALFMDCSQ